MIISNEIIKEARMLSTEFISKIPDEEFFQRVIDHGIAKAFCSTINDMFRGVTYQESTFSIHNGNIVKCEAEFLDMNNESFTFQMNFEIKLK